LSSRWGLIECDFEGFQCDVLLSVLDPLFSLFYVLFQFGYVETVSYVLCDLWDMLPEDMADCTDDEIMEKLYKEDDALSDLSKPFFCSDRK
jgi:hypothetical protein